MRKDRTKQRIAILHYAARPVIGGVEATIYHHARGLADLGYQVQVVAGRGEAFDDRVAFRHIPEIDSKHPEGLALNKDLDEGGVGEGFPLLQHRIAAALREALADTDTCIVHNAFTLHKNLPLTAALHQLAEEGYVRFIAWCHDLAWTNPLYRPQLSDRHPWNLLKKPLGGVRYVAVSRSRRRELAHLLNLSEEEIRVIPPGVEPLEFLGLATTTRRLAERLDLLRGEPLMLLPARLTRRKNIELALRVTAALKERRWAPKLIVTGPPGPHNVRNIAYLHRLEELRQRLGLGEEVIFLHECQDEDGERIEVSDAMMADLYRLADLLFLPSSQEGFGIPLLEAGLARLPTFCADIPPLRESGEGVARFFSLEDKPAEIAQRIAAFLAEDPTYQMRRRVLRRYTWSAILTEEIVPLLEGGSDG